MGEWRRRQDQVGSAWGGVEEKTVGKVIEKHLEGTVKTQDSGKFLESMRVFLLQTPGNGDYRACTGHLL